jgi:transcriptional/translational regulatory protein YebC/TACO1
MWAFEQKGIVSCHCVSASLDKIMDLAIDLGAEDVDVDNDDTHQESKLPPDCKALTVLCATTDVRGLLDANQTIHS